MNDIYQLIFRTGSDWPNLVLRVALGTMIFAHGAQKLLGWFGGYGFEGTMTYFTTTLGIPWLLAFGVILIEFVGGLMLIAGLGVRIWAVAVSIIMVTAALMVHWPHGFFMNWFGNQKGEGLEFFLLAIALGVALAIGGAGRYSIDGLIQQP